MELERAFPIWEQLTDGQRALLRGGARFRRVPPGTLLHNGAADCVGLFLVCSGQLRAFILSPEGKEVTLYRLFERDMCLFSASCMLHSVQFDLAIESEKETELWVVAPDAYKALMAESAAVANYTNELMASRFSEVMWLVEQILWQRFDRRLSEFLLAESALEGGDTLLLTHDRIAAHLGTAREVVTRMLRYFQSEGMVRLTRGSVELTDRAALERLAN